MTVSLALRVGLSTNLEAIYLIFWGILGASWGSFVNAVGFRLLSPKLGESSYGSGTGLSLSDRSQCFHCHKVLSPIDLIPILSFGLLLGRSRCCRQKMPYSYIFSEILFLFLFILIFVVHWPVAMILSAIGIFSTLYLLTISDYLNFSVPVYLIFLLSIFDFLWLAVSPDTIHFEVFASILFGFIILFLPGLLVSVVMRRSSLGLADPIIFSILSGCFELDTVPYFLILSASIGIIWKLFNKKNKEIPFLPSMSIAFSFLWIYLNIFLIYF